MEEITDGLDNLVVGKRAYLLVLDMNGLLIHREPYSEKRSKTKRERKVWKRPHLDGFLHYIFDNFEVGVWSSMTWKNLEPLQDFAFGDHKPLFTFDNGHCDKEERPGEKDLLKKPLSKVWERYPEFSRENTLLIDDSAAKAKDNPPHLLFCPAPWTIDCTEDEINEALGPDGIIRCYLQRLLDSERTVPEFVVQEEVDHPNFRSNTLESLFLPELLEDLVPSCGRPDLEKLLARVEDVLTNRPITKDTLLAYIFHPHPSIILFADSLSPSYGMPPLSRVRLYISQILSSVHIDN